ncbi:MAG: urea carboxylase-associated protein [Halobacteriovoraceae bacterium]|nr:urea carboxylase-associated protein [Halobacteriovoraceae bacterium]|tara:strand:+ start:2582 stop:3160 length:579 start_codon:yes stop_codon:yes gene_type:complete
MPIVEQRTGVAFELKKGQKLKVIDIEGKQVSDLFCYIKGDYQDYLSNGRTFDYASKILLSTGDLLYSSKSKPMFKIIEDSNGSHDFLLTPCSHDTFSILYEDYQHRGCEGNLLHAFKEYDENFKETCLPATFNIFMNVPISSKGQIEVIEPTTIAGDFITFEALDDLIVGLTSCSAPQSNGGSFKPIKYEVI